MGTPGRCDTGGWHTKTGVRKAGLSHTLWQPMLESERSCKLQASKSEATGYQGAYSLHATKGLDENLYQYQPETRLGPSPKIRLNNPESQ